MIRSDKDRNLIYRVCQEILQLECDNRKGGSQAKLPMVRAVIVRRNEAGHLVDGDGNRYNEEGDQLDANGNRLPVPAGPRTLAEMNRPDTFYANRSALLPPAFERDDFELKLQYYTAVAQHQFHGHPSEHPMDHLERFEGLLNGLKAAGVDEDYFKMQLFSYSLAGDALNWLNTQRPGTFTTWDDVRKAFLENFFDDAKSEELRTNISGFEQRPKETFKNAWIRFKKLQRDCPHHGFTDSQLLTTFFKGVDWRHQQSLDSASNGNFMTRSTESAVELIHNLSQSNSTKRCDEARAREAANNPQDIDELKSSLLSIQNLLMKKQKAVSFVNEVDEFEPQEEDVNFVGGAGFQGQRFNNFTGNNFKGNYGNQQRQQSWNNDGYRGSPRAEKATQSVLEQILEGQKKITNEFNTKFDGLRAEMNQKFGTIDDHLRELDLRAAQNADDLKRYNQVIHGNRTQHPSNHVNVVSSLFEKEVLGYDSKAVEHFYDEVGSDRKQENHGKDDLVGFGQSKNVQNTHHQKGVTIATTPVSRSRPSTEMEKFASLSMKDKVQGSSSTTPVPSYKCSMVSSKIIRTHEEVIAEIALQVPEVLKYKDYPRVRRHIEKAYHNLISINDAVDLIYVECLEIQNDRELREMCDPGGFLINCKVGGKQFNGVMCDSGSSVNVIPLSAAKGLGELHPCPMTITLADQSVRNPEGWLMNVPIELGDTTILADFVVMDLAKEPREPLILGRGFLATAGAVIDFRHGLVELRLPNKTMHFIMDRGDGKHVDGTKHEVNTISILGEDERVFNYGVAKEILSPNEPATAVKQQAPVASPPPPKQRYVPSKPKKKSKSKRNAGKKSIPPTAVSHPGVIPSFLGRAHAPNAYTPPWMRRIVLKDSVVSTKPPDI